MRLAAGSVSPDGDAPDGPARPPRVLVAGLSTRAIAESAARAGVAVRSLDGFGDLDHAARPALALARDFGLAYDAAAIARIGRDIECDAVVYVASLENHPRAVARLAGGRALWGNSPAVLERVRDPVRLARALRARSLPAAAVRTVPPRAAEAPARWLVKPRASGGGHGIVPWRRGSRLPRRHVLQERIDGVPGSLVFAADGRDAVPFGISWQLAGERELGASGFQYCGSILAPAPALLPAATAIAQALVEAFGLVGVNGVDFVARDGVPVPIEVNPRCSASMELAERAFGFSVFRAHVDGCAGALPRFDLAGALRAAPGAVGKAVLYARRSVLIGDSRRWLERDDVRDVPHPGERIAAGRPICTIFARGRDAGSCRAALVRRARKLYEEIEGRGRRIA
ncbi:MAG TPA: ATP-grasp domain-containing protein [Gemmatimonadaceae bacterium]|nr:ATP-grasp domain-containing protein [Gemmatimonadaceae bacterium]